MKKKRVIIMSVIILIAIGAIFPIKSYMDLRTYNRQVSEISIKDVDLSKVPDGVYTGSYDVSWVAAEVEVTVKDHKISDIALTNHKNGKGKPAEIILQKVVESQNLNVDIVTGATSSSKVILKSIENALNSVKK